MTALPLPSLSGTKPSLSERFAQKASRLQSVEAVIVRSTNDTVTIWTILDREPYRREIRDAVYDLEVETLNEFPEAHVDFRLINTAEYDTSAEVHLPVGTVLYKRR
jgi:hypothetical protein